MELVLCKKEEDYEKFILFFLRNRNIFSNDYSLLEAVGSLYIMMGETNIVNFINDEGEIIAAICYSYGTRENNFEDKHIVFVDCAIIEKQYQGSLVFVRYFQQWIKYLEREDEKPEEIQFHAHRHHKYVHRLYNKFAKVIGEAEDQFGIKDVFSVEYDRLVAYLDRFNREKVYK
ncbi:hypothetical protein AAGS61_00705 [Lysinibacillus sp. KU-BSD001]|uniref:hypothetical protein n=1 Tax=Lysinibacillus sp. KU-BSD001 TaxID=3141328 RepID=UPI0036F04970